MKEYELTLSSPRPFFAEIPYYLWGSVNYDSEGDCERPTDTSWTWIDITHRVSGETVNVTGSDNSWTISGDTPVAARTAAFLVARCGASAGRGYEADSGEWDHQAGLARSARMAAEFVSPELAAFDSHLFWGSWKWIGWFATDFTWVGRWIMHSVRVRDPRGVFLCIDWLKHGTCHTNQSGALRTALRMLTEQSFDTDSRWIAWYQGGLLRRGAKRRFPKPDFDQWLAELKAEYPD